MMIFKKNGKGYEHQTGYVVQLVAQAIGEGELTKEMAVKTVDWLKEKLTEPTKICTVCGEEKGVDCFSENRNQCKTCKAMLRSQREKELYATDELFNRKKHLRNMLYRAKNSKDYRHSPNYDEFVRVVGCDDVFFRQHLAQTYRKEYNEEFDGDYSKVHIDHIEPLDLAKTVEDVDKLYHYTNLRLLKAKDNMKKGSKSEDYLTGEYH